MNRLFGKGKWRFQNVQVTESTDRLINPACGWCRIYTFYLERKIDFDELYWSLQDNETLVQAVIVIGAFRSLEIPGEALLQLEQLMQFFREHQKEMILRFTYDNTGQGLLAEPDEIQQIVIHIRQIGSLLRQYADDILLQNANPPQRLHILFVQNPPLQRCTYCYRNLLSCYITKRLR